MAPSGSLLLTAACTPPAGWVLSAKRIQNLKEIKPASLSKSPRPTRTNIQGAFPSYQKDDSGKQTLRADMGTSQLPRKSSRSLLFCSNTKSNSECARGHRNELHKRLLVQTTPSLPETSSPRVSSVLGIQGMLSFPAGWFSPDRDHHPNRFNSSSSRCRSK